MAGTEHDSTTSADFRLASDELAFVTKLVNPAFVTELADSEKRAKEILLDGLAKELIRWDCDPSLTVRGDFQAYPLLRATFTAARGHAFFWRRDEHSRIDMDWSTDRAVWAGPFIGFGSDGRGESWPIFEPPAHTTLVASSVRFHHGDVVNYLVTLGLMPRPPAPSPPSPPPQEPITLPPPPLEQGSAPIVAPTEGSQEERSDKIAPATEKPREERSGEIAETAPATTTKQKRQRTGKWEQLIDDAIAEIYPGGLPSLTAAKLQHAIEALYTRNHWKAGSRCLPPNRYGKRAAAT